MKKVFFIGCAINLCSASDSFIFDEKSKVYNTTLNIDINGNQDYEIRNISEATTFDFSNSRQDSTEGRVPKPRTRLPKLEIIPVPKPRLHIPFSGSTVSLPNFASSQTISSCESSTYLLNSEKKPVKIRITSSYIEPPRKPFLVHIVDQPLEGKAETITIKEESSEVLGKPEFDFTIPSSKEDLSSSIIKSKVSNPVKDKVEVVKDKVEVVKDKVEVVKDKVDVVKPPKQYKPVYNSRVYSTNFYNQTTDNSKTTPGVIKPNSEFANVITTNAKGEMVCRRKKTNNPKTLRRF